MDVFNTVLGGTNFGDMKVKLQTRVRNDVVININLYILSVGNAVDVKDLNRALDIGEIEQVGGSPNRNYGRTVPNRPLCCQGKHGVGNLRATV